MPLPKVPTNQKKASTYTVALRSGVTTRNQQAMDTNNVNNSSKPSVFKDFRSKRKAEASPFQNKTIKRSALGNITNAVVKTQAKKPLKKSTVMPVKQVQPAEVDKVIPKKQPANTVVANLRSKLTAKTSVAEKNDEEKSDESSLYVSALEDVSGGSANKYSATVEKIVKKEEPPKRELPMGVSSDFDIDNWRDPYQVSQYAAEIFEYLKSRESKFPIIDYMEQQSNLTQWMRSLLVDWMVELQESFELNHETLYLAVKLVDLYLCKVTLAKEMLQLLGAASLFIASKFDERIPPVVGDFLYICDGAYSQRELLRMEMNILKVVDFDLGIPLSYRFLRRYARCLKVSMPTLTFARYILEYSLMDYATIKFSDSKIAAAALFLALYTKDLGKWSPALEYYTGYKLYEIRDIVVVLNNGLHRKPKDDLVTIREKYSHKIFFEVAKIPLKPKLNI